MAKRLLESVGGTLHHYFFTAAEGGYVVLCELPDATAAAAAGLAISASGAFSTNRVSPLMTVTEAQAACPRRRARTIHHRGGEPLYRAFQAGG